MDKKLLEDYRQAVERSNKVRNELSEVFRRYWQSLEELTQAFTKMVDEFNRSREELERKKVN
jgi:MoCo/4Fe-4S cofactor protein with predicted Tat translocation signal